MRTQTLHLGRFTMLKEQLAKQLDFDINAPNASDKTHFCLPHLEPWLPGTWNFGLHPFPLQFSDGADPKLVEYAEACRDPGHQSNLLVIACANKSQSRTRGCLLWVGNPNDPNAIYRCTGDSNWLVASGKLAAPSKGPFFYENTSLWALPVGAKLTVDYVPAEVRNSNLVAKRWTAAIPLYVVTVEEDRCQLAITPQGESRLPKRLRATA